MKNAKLWKRWLTATFPAALTCFAALAFVHELAVGQVTYGTPTKLAGASNPAFYETESRWTPDGQYVLFSANSSGNYDIFRVPAAGGTPERLTTSAKNEAEPNLGNDGWLYYSVREETRIYRMRLDGSSNESLVAGSDPQISPDGTFLIYYIGEFLYRFNLLTRTSSSLGIRGAHPRLSKDGLLVAYESYSGYAIWVASAVNGSGQHQVSTRINDSNDGGGGLDWSPSPCQKLVFFGAPRFAPPCPEGDLWTINLDRSSPQKITTGKGSSWPSWSFDGSKIAFSSCVDGDIYVMTASGCQGQAPIASHDNSSYLSSRCFNGSSDYVQLPIQSLNNMAQGTVEMWVRFSSLATTAPPQTGEQILISRSLKDEVQADFRIAKEEDDGTARANKFLMSLNNGNTRVYSITKAVAGQWYHVAASWDSHFWCLYVNGVLEGSAANTTVLPNQPTYEVLLGKIHNWLSRPNYYYFTGDMDEVRISNRARLPQEFCLTAPCGTDANTVGLWHLDNGSLVDVTGVSNGTANGSGCGGQPPIANHDDLIFGTGRCFNGTDDYVLVPNSAGLNVTGGLTLEAWIKMDELPTVQEYAIVSKWAGTGSAGGRYLFGVAGGTNSGKLLLNLQDAWAYSSRILQANRWYHVAVCFSGSQITFYIDGQLDSQTPATSGFGSSSTPLAIGKNIHNNTNASVQPYYFKGNIDEVRISNKARLPQEFCLTAPCGTDANTVGLWHLDNGSLVDVTGLNNGTANGSGCGGQSAPKISLSAMSYDYGQVQLGSSSDWTIQVGNSGNASLLISNVSSDNPDFSPILPSNIAPGSSATGSILFEPGVAGPAIGKVTFVTNDPTMPQVILNLAGSGYGGGKTVWRFTIEAAVTQQTATYYGGIDAVRTLILNQFITINQKFNVPEVFNGIFDFEVIDVHQISGSSQDERWVPHPSSQIKVIYDGYASHGGWYGRPTNVIAHEWPVGSDGGLFSSMVTDALVHEFGHSRGAIEINGLKVDPSKNPISREGFAGPTSIMNSPYGESTWDPHSVSLINSNTDQIMVSEDYITKSFPPSIRMLTETKSGSVLPHVSISLYPVEWRSEAVSPTALFTLRTDDAGVGVLPSNPFGPGTGDNWLIHYPNFLVVAQLGEEQVFGWLPLNEVQNEYFKRPNVPYTMRLQLNAPAAPTAVITQSFLPPNLKIGQTFSLSAENSTGVPPLSYLWNFGDGTSATDSKPSHYYLACDNYTISLTIKDSYGNTAAVSQGIDVTLSDSKEYVRNPNALHGWKPIGWKPGDVTRLKVRFDDAKLSIAEIESIKRAFETWSSLKYKYNSEYIQYVAFDYVTGLQADVYLTKARTDDLATTYSKWPLLDVRPFSEFDIYFNPDIRWFTTEKPNGQRSQCNPARFFDVLAESWINCTNPIDMEGIALHEIGHVLGLDEFADDACGYKDIRYRPIMKYVHWENIDCVSPWGEFQHNLGFGELEFLDNLYGPTQQEQRAFYGQSPIDLEVITPSGNIINKTTRAPNAYYSEVKGSSSNGLPIDRASYCDAITIFNDEKGVYRVRVIPDNSATPDSIFSIVVCGSEGRTSLASSMRIDAIPPDGFIFNTFPYASLKGYVKDGTGMGLLGVKLDLHTSAGDIVKSLVTDNSGFYHVDSIPNGNYSIIIHQPLGYESDSLTKHFTVNHVPVSVDFTLTKYADIAKASVIPTLWYNSWTTSATGTVRAYVGSIPAGHTASNIVPSSVMLNAKVPIFNNTSRVRPSMTGFTGSVLEIAFNRQLAVQSLGTPIHDSTYQVIISGDFTDGVKFVAPVEVVLVGGTVLAKESIEGESAPLPESYTLGDAYPNPFNPITTIEFGLPVAGSVTLEVFNVLGQKVRTLANGPVPAGYHSIEWNSTNDAGQPVSSGVYLYRLTAGDFVETKKMILLK